MKAILLMAVIVCSVFTCFGNPVTGTFNFQSAWNEVDKLHGDRLPKSMVAKVDSIYAAAVQENKVDQQVKALVYQLVAMQQVEEFSAQKAITKVQAQLATASFPASAIMHSMLAQLYWSYYQNNRGRFSKRSETINFQRDDIATWDLKTISKETIREYQLSLQQPVELQKLLLDDYPAILNQGGKDERNLRPTLYDKLAHQAIDFFQNDESGLTLPPEEFSITDSKFFQNAAGFATMIVSSPDSLSLKYQATLLYQGLIRFHLQDADPSALVEVNLERLEFIYRNCKLPKPEQYYEAALRNEQAAYQNHPVYALISFKLAMLYASLGDKYNPEVSEDYRWHYKYAMEICEQAYKTYPQSFGGQSCRGWSQIKGVPAVNLTVEQYVLPGAPVKALLNAKDVNNIRLSVYRIPYPSLVEQNYYEDRDWEIDSYKKLYKLLEQYPLWSKSFTVTNEGDYRNHSYELAIGSLHTGHYILVASDLNDDHAYDGLLAYSLFSSTELTYITPSIDINSMLIANRRTGQPIAGARLRQFVPDNAERYNAEMVLKFTQATDAQGLISIPADYESNWRYTANLLITSGADSLFIGNFCPYGTKYNPAPVKKCLLFTDRAIYRPGQTIYFKGILYESDGENKYALQPGRDIATLFRDANGQQVSGLKLKTNDYGTFNGSFTAPKGVLTGAMSIVTNYGSVSFNVEEYKRPRFEVTLNKPKESYKLNQQVSISGKALSYAGFPIDNAKVSYRISRQPKYPCWYWWWGAMPSTSQKEIVNGSALTDSNGEFTLKFTATGDETALPKYNPYFNFSISVDVTDISGETRSGTLQLAIGEQELVLNPGLPSNVNLKDKRLVLPISSTNLSGEKVAAQGKISITRLEAPDHVQKKRLWQAPDRDYLTREEFLKQFPTDVYGREDEPQRWKKLEAVYNASFNTAESESLCIKDLQCWKPGAYVLEAIANYKQQEVKVLRYFTVYSSASEFLPYPMPFWLVPVKVNCEPGESAEVLIGSGYDDVSLLYEVEKDHEVVESKRIALDCKQRLFKVPVSETDRGGFYLHFTYIRDGRLYTYSQAITVLWTNKQISFEYSTFRNKLLPGEEEEWRLKLKDHTGGKVTAEVLASMYDASLDAFKSSSWNASVYGKMGKSGGWSNSNLIGLSYLITVHGPDYHGYMPTRHFDTFNWYRYSLWYWGYRTSADMVGSSKAISMNEIEYNSSVSDVSNIVAMQPGVANIGGELHIRGSEADGVSAGTPAPEDLSTLQARSNFAETAFFYPTLETDANGEVSFVFTVPEALTKWKFRALALTKDLKIGQTENGTITQKPLMVMPNAPRFFREGDRIVFSTKITALDEADQSGNCQLFLFDALSMEPVEQQFDLRSAQQPFTVKKGESTVLSWELQVPFGMSAVTYRVVAKAGDFSDGEENTLPILSNRMLVTESLPLPVRGNCSRDFIFQKLKDSGKSSTISNHKLTLEYTSNPAWYAIQALPYMMEYPYSCNEQIFSQLYANSLASHIANSSPRIKQVFEAWKNTPASSALLSNLEKNQELKALLLQETPWVMDAKDEAQSKQRIGLLFELNNLAEQQNAAIGKLQKNQSSSGAWPWFAGMQDSWWVTQYIVEGMGHLDRLGVTDIRKDTRVWNMLKAAIGYIDIQIVNDYESIKKNGFLELDHLGYMEMHYLYARSFFRDLPIPQSTQEAFQYFSGQADDFWMEKGLYGQGMIALARQREASETTPQKIIRSLKERALHDEELGMWWKNDQWGWFWYQAPIETQSLLIEAFLEVASDTLSVDEMRTWLLKQKQTTNWKTTKATAEACYALLLSGTEWLAADQMAEITMGGSKLDPTKLEGVQPEAGTGYFKTSWTGSEITPKMAEISISNPNPVPSWGSLYWQYFENLDKITPAETPLKLTKQLFIERITNTGKVLDPVSDQSQLHIGDKVIVRIELRSDRDMEYVHLKDMRSAGFEPINVLSQTKWQDGLCYYEATGDAATNFFIEYLRKGTFVFEYPLRVTNKGDFSNGITSIQCMYAPEFTAHSAGIRVEVK